MKTTDNPRFSAPEGPRQVFYASSPGRWKKFVWSMRLIVSFMILSAVLVTIAVFRLEPVGLPPILSQNETYKTILNPDHPAMVKTRTSIAFQQARAKAGAHATFNYGRRVTR